MREDSNPDAAAALLLGACFHRAFLRRFLSENAASTGEESFAEDVVRSLTRGLPTDRNYERDTE